MHWKVEVIIPVYRDPEGLEGCLSNLAKQDEPAFRVWVCVDGRVGSMIEVVKAYRHRLSAIQLLHHPGESHCGRAATRNLALPYVTAPITLFLDADLRPLPDWVRRHWELACQQPHTAAVGHLCYVNHRDNLWADLYNRKLKRRRHLMVLPSYQFTTGNAMVRTEWWQSVGGFDPTFREYGAEDADLMVRIARHYPVTVRYHRWAVTVGQMRKSPDTVLAERIEMGATTLRRFIAKHPQEGNYFRCRRFDSWLFRVLFSAPIRQGMHRLMDDARWPRAWRRWALDYLTVAALYQGWRDSANSS